MMGFSTTQRPDFRDMQAVSMSLADAALTENVAQLRRIAVSMRAHVRGIEHDLTVHRRMARDVPAIIARSSDDQIDLAVDQLLRHEQVLREAWEQTAQLCRRLEAKARHLRPATFPLVRQITGAAESWYRPFVIFLSYVRCDIMERQAEREPDSSCPVLASVSDVDAYFRSLPPAA